MNRRHFLALISSVPMLKLLPQAHPTRVVVSKGGTYMVQRGHTFGLVTVPAGYVFYGDFLSGSAVTGRLSVTGPLP